MNKIFGVSRITVIVSVVSFCIFMAQKTAVTYAACSPAECNVGILRCLPSEHCLAYCCVPDTCVPSCTNYCGTKSDGCGGTCPCVECGPSAIPACGDYVKLYNCKASEYGCTECGPYGTQSCGSWTQTYDCSDSQSGCTECGPSLGAWTVCDSNHLRTRTCSENCGTNDCDALGAVGGIITESCIGTITGTLFDASDVSSCSDLGSTPKFGNQSLTVSPVNIGLWPVITNPVSTNANGVYTESVYASATLPASYQFDYSDFLASGVVAGIKLECQGLVSTVTGQAQVVTKDTGFWRVYGGWWQVVGGNVYAKSGLQSNVPASIAPLVSPFVNQRLILADANGRTGVLSHGFAWQGTELGTNPNVGVSDSQLRVQSEYDGLRYDYNLYQTRMDIFVSTPWTGGSISYDDNGVGYQIFKYSGGGTVDIPATSLVGGQKAIFLVNGNVTVSGDLSVDNDSFLGVIAKGNITFSPSVTTAQGWFVAENINIPCLDVSPSDGVCDKTDTQFDGQGSFVAWTGFNLGRDMFTGNNTAPSEKFTYRSDMMINAPTPIKVYARKFSSFIP